MKHPGAATLRLARLPDARELAEMSRDLIEIGLYWRYTPARMASLITERETATVVASDASGIQGLAVMQFGDTDAHLALLCVRPAVQRRGLGGGLHDWLIESAMVAGMESVRLELRADNDGCRAFYQRLGYAETDLVPGYYDRRIAARRMQLALRDPGPPGAHDAGQSKGAQGGQR